MDEKTLNSLQVVWEQLNSALYDLTEGNPKDAQDAIEDCIIRLEIIGINQKR